MQRVLQATTAFVILLAFVFIENAGSHRHSNSTWVPVKYSSNSKFNTTGKHSGVGLDSPVLNPIVISQQVLFESGEADVLIYRCPLLTYTPGGHLLVIAEARKNNGDQDLKYIATRRSTDGGFNWEPEAFVYNDGTNRKEDNLGVVLVDDVTKEIYVFYVVCAHISSCDPGSVPSVMYMKSTDDGVTWKPPVNVTAQAGPKNFAPGPGPGVQKKFSPYKGRLIVCGHGGMLTVNGVFCLLSDDHGVTWRWGAEVLPIPAYTANKQGDFVPDECQPTELADGSMMLNVRNQYRYHCNCRIVMMSHDGMETIDMKSIRLDETLIEPAVCSSILTKNGVVFFANPASETKRQNMTLRWSFDSGATWPGSLPIWEYASGYSCMTTYPGSLGGLSRGKYIYLAFEKGRASYTETVSFVTISLDGSL